MKTKPSAIKSLLAAALAASCLASYAAAPQKREMKFEKLRKEFADPPRAFRPAPLWVWNNDVGEGYDTAWMKTPETRRWMDEKGITEHHCAWQGLVKIE